jgi:hypothetical protein
MVMTEGTIKLEKISKAKISAVNVRRVFMALFPIPCKSDETLAG